MIEVDMQWHCADEYAPDHGVTVLTYDIYSEQVALGKYDEEKELMMNAMIDEPAVDFTPTHWAYICTPEIEEDYEPTLK